MYGTDVHAPTEPDAMTLRSRVHRLLVLQPDSPRATRVVNWFLMALIMVNVIAVILQTVKSIDDAALGLFTVIEFASVLIFSAEYLVRVWVCVERPEYRRPIVGRLRYMVSFYALVDLIAVLPFYLVFFSWDLRFTRILRLGRFLWIAKLGRQSVAMQAIVAAFRRQRYELGATLFILVMLLLIASSAMYFAEHEAQPEEFSSIPAAMWWSVVTLTTVGYGDLTPVTIVGKLLGASIAVVGILMFALPTAILGSGFMVELQTRRSRTTTCPSCGASVPLP